MQMQKIQQLKHETMFNESVWYTLEGLFTHLNIYICVCVCVCLCVPICKHTSIRAFDNILNNFPFLCSVSLAKNIDFGLYRSESLVEVNTIDSFQGQERDVVVVSLARSQGLGFLTDIGRMNVMLTRAKHTLIICLNPFALLV